MNDTRDRPTVDDIPNTEATEPESSLLVQTPRASRELAERRRAPRVAARLLVRCPRDRRLDGETRDISISGTFVETAARPDVSSQHEIDITLARQNVPATVEVARHAVDGVGLRFTSPSSPLTEALEALTQQARS